MINFIAYEQLTILFVHSVKTLNREVKYLQSSKSSLLSVFLHPRPHGFIQEPLSAGNHGPVEFWLSTVYPLDPQFDRTISFWVCWLLLLAHLHIRATRIRWVKKSNQCMSDIQLQVCDYAVEAKRRQIKRLIPKMFSAIIGFCLLICEIYKSKLVINSKWGWSTLRHQWVVAVFELSPTESFWIFKFDASATTQYRQVSR